MLDLSEPAMLVSRDIKPSQAAPAGKLGPDKGSPFYVPPFLDFLGGLVERFRTFWLGLGRLEARLLEEQLNSVQVRMPIYVCGLARSGSTVLHEIVAAAPGVATHRVKDYPMVYTPYWWRRATARQPPAAPRERVHRDRVLITPESPDALEEMLWIPFFPHCHDPSVDNRLPARRRHPVFEAFYRAHLRKLLLAERATRYAAKANYHVARLAYLVRLFPDAKIILPVRAPAGHIASLVRQHQWFCRGQRSHPRALAWMQRSGHFEFGRDRRPMNLGDGERVRAILRAWAQGEEVRGWARYWDMVYGHVIRLLDVDARIRAATKVLRYEDLCAAPAQTIRTVLDHCLLPEGERIVARFTPSIRSPDYYQCPFSSAELALIQEETAATASALQGLC
jgi:hypothetical protein